MINISYYNNIYKILNKKYNLPKVQLVTSDLSMIQLLVYIQDKHSNNICFIRKNRVKTGIYSKIEGKLNNRKILVIENIIYDSSNISYIEKSLELKGKKINYIFVPILNSKIKNDYNFDYFLKKSYNIGFNNLIEKKGLELVFESKNQNLINLYKKNFIQINKSEIIFIDDSGVLYCFNKDFTIKWKAVIFQELKISFKPLFIKNHLYLISSDGDLYKISILNGNIVEKKPVCDLILSRIYYYKNQESIVVFGINSSINNKYSMFIINLSNFYIKEIFIQSNIVSDVFAYDNSIFFGNNNSELVVYDNGKLSFFKIDGDTIGGFEKIKNFLYFGTKAGSIYIYDILKKQIIFNKKITNYWIPSKPLFYKGLLYITSVDKKMYILDSMLNLVSYIETKGRIFSSPKIIKEDIVCFGSNDSRLYFFNINNKKITYYQFSERIITTPLLFNNKLVIQDFLNNIYKINC